MQQLSDEEKLQIQGLAREFTTQTLGDSCPRGMCFTICYPLYLYLGINRFTTSMKADLFTVKDVPGAFISHYWLSLNDEKETIIDPTIRQFDKQAPYVYFGEKPKDYDEEKIPLKEWFDDTYEKWRGQLLEPQQRKIDIKVLLKINLTTATILDTEREKKGGIHSDELELCYEKYFNCICEVIHEYHDKQEMKGLSLPKSLIDFCQRH